MNLGEIIYKRIAFIGCGNIARYHAEVLLSLGCSIVAVAARKGSANINNFAKIYGIPAKYHCWKRMIKNENIDAIIVTASWDSIDNIILPLLKYDIPCFVEKPIALTSKKVEKIIS